MSNVGAIIKGRAVEVADSVYMERREQREPAIEEYLRAIAARLPKLKSHKKRIRSFIALAGEAEKTIRPLNDEALVSELRTICMQMRRQGFVDELLVRAFAIVREASFRTLGMRHHDVQLIGGWALLQGMIAEMETGEGKTLVATLAACTAGAAGAAVHVITVNDYLAERDAEKNGALYRFFGLQVGVIKEGMSPQDRRAQYLADIVYVSNKEIVFDYLKDQIATGGAIDAHYRLRHVYRSSQPPDVLLRGLHVAIVDEADSILIDEARTPLIISETKPNEHGDELYHNAIELASRLEQGRHFHLTAHREIWITPEGEQFIGELASDLQGVWTSSLWRRELFEKALAALWCYQKDQHYIISEGKVQIVDEFSGRVMEDRSWESGLHQMIEAKEECEISGQRKTLSRMTYQRFLKRYLLLCGMTGTAAEIKTELRRVYDLDVLKIPTHVPSKRKRLSNRCWKTSEERWRAIAKRAAELSQSGIPVLIGTRSIEASEELSRYFQESGMDHAVLNARNDKEEADIVAQAGQVGRITIATNMAGRGTDIKPAEEASRKGGLHVILTEFHESSRIDRQLFGRCARQGEPGVAGAMVSLDDELFQRFVPSLRNIAMRMSEGKETVPEWLVNSMVTLAQILAERHNAGIRMATLKQDRKLQSLLSFAGSSV